MTDKLILLTNDDGIASPGLWAAARALQPLGQVVVAAPRVQCTSVGRGQPSGSSGRIETRAGAAGPAYAVDGTPAQAVLYALVELLPRAPDLVVAGINYGDNVGTGVTASGTVGAALEAASFGLPALAVSLDTDPEHHYQHSPDVDFTGAAYFTGYFAGRLLGARLPFDADVLKVEVPRAATADTPWRLTRLSRTRFYFPVRPERRALSEPGPLGYRIVVEAERLEPDSDVRAVLDGVVAVTPLSLDLTARVDLAGLDRALRG